MMPSSVLVYVLPVAQSEYFSVLSPGLCHVTGVVTHYLRISPVLLFSALTGSVRVERALERRSLLSFSWEPVVSGVTANSLTSVIGQRTNREHP